MSTPVRMKVAVTGGIACGKSLLTAFLRELGLRVLDADDVVHDLEGVGGAAVPALVARFGREILASDGAIDRARLAARVFASAEQRCALEAILFPLVRKRLSAFAAGPASPQAAPPLVVAPLLYEAHFETDYDTVVALVSSPEVQIQRMMETRGYSREHAEARLAAQMPAAEKAARADYVIVNDSTAAHLRDEARRLVHWLQDRR